MKGARFDEFESGVGEWVHADDQVEISSLTTKLERRRRIEALEEEKRLREELGDFAY